MDSWLGWIILLAIGIGLLAGATWLDVRRRRRADGGAAAPERGHDLVDQQQPDYVAQSQIDAMPMPGADGTAPPDRPGVRFGFGHAAEEFATAGGVAVLEDASILMVDDHITSIRELLPALGGAGPLVIAALGISDEVLATLRANRKALNTDLVAALPSRRDLYELCAITGGEVLTAADLQAGYVPRHALGAARRWTSTLRATWVDPVDQPLET